MASLGHQRHYPCLGYVVLLLHLLKPCLWCSGNGCQCFDLFVVKSELVISSTPLLSIFISMGDVSLPMRSMSEIKFRIHTASRAVSEAAIYSASLELSATDVCFCDLHEIGPFDSMKTYALTERLFPVSWPPQSDAIGKPVSDSNSFLYSIPIWVMPFR